VKALFFLLPLLITACAYLPNLPGVSGTLPCVQVSARPGASAIALLRELPARPKIDAVHYENCPGSDFAACFTQAQFENLIDGIDQEKEYSYRLRDFYCEQAAHQHLYLNTCHSVILPDL
jgi:hypothetical protein